ncbi:SAM-dependent methyltransferase [Mesorhizobium huakuii]|uniref:SAM-dependent methyltransferase n=1 Tax=Mesorhizobium huakuii TaxID=28104 RepID=A0A7G6SYY0_9HYPH|nr:SAM-dependent methyltransferase [Mesorhizobium huakuii]QND59712.1 SAM-dependent methyltransferase [Mesorhizobium huakuii]
MQNKSHAVMAQRHEPADSLDDFPTPPWATRALIEHVIGAERVAGGRCLEPACGRGHMAKALEPYFADVVASDVASYGFGEQRDFLGSSLDQPLDWTITNPPFRLAEDFFHHGFAISQEGVALLTRTVFLEGKGRLERIFSKYPPTIVAQLGP